MKLEQHGLLLAHPGEGMLLFAHPLHRANVGPPSALCVSQVLSWYLPQVSPATLGALLSMNVQQVTAQLPYLDTLASGAHESSHIPHS